MVDKGSCDSQTNCKSLSLAMVTSDYTKQRILSLAWKGCKVSAIVECLVLEDGIRTTK